MSREVIATPLFARRLQVFLDDYREKGAVRFIERLKASYLIMLENIAGFEEIAPARRRTVGGRSITAREYLLDAGAREFLVLYWIPTDPQEPVLLLNIRIGGQNRYRWKELP